ncbi:MAG TPA: NfeD family protein, partial [Pirellula sp.]|nr:NfeD family protein [Pirellula sp.]
VIFSIAGIVIAYMHFGAEIGWYVLVSTTVIKVAVIYWSFQSGAWARFSLKTAITSKVNEGVTRQVAVGEKGKATTTLRPSGKAIFGDQLFEVRTPGGYVDTGADVRFTEITENQIIVEPTN